MYELLHSREYFSIGAFMKICV